MNHHGPLPVDTGGKCGGKVTAANLIRVITANAVEGDAIIVVGDFNAAPASDTVSGLSQYLVHIFNGAMCGGIDNILSNTPPSSVIGTRNLGDGGSDHDAIQAVIEIGTAGGMDPNGPAGVGEGDHTTPPPAGQAPSPEGGCKCQCKWAHTPGACDASSVDQSCCWQQCCLEVGITPANSGGGLEPVAAEPEDACECDWATPAACKGPSDGTVCHDKCCSELGDQGGDADPPADAAPADAAPADAAAEDAAAAADAAAEADAAGAAAEVEAAAVLAGEQELNM
ncbi:unnamed protein product [Prorocentrum cordatum]|uniref:Endonuclease/exonuclease/phosphatase domain-containing protein n=1 Tax=Prorocentrum cordatum TaxID=2364126 RepID=A0ABN9T0V6_9DINO|nr:unnamed protein product [Polarella glacialis]